MPFFTSVDCDVSAKLTAEHEQVLVLRMLTNDIHRVPVGYIRSKRPPAVTGILTDIDVHAIVVTTVAVHRGIHSGIGMIGRLHPADIGSLR